MLKEIDLQSAEKALDNARAMMTKFDESSFSWPNKETFEADINTISRLLAEMQQALSGLFAQLSEPGNLVYETLLDSEVGEAIYDSFNLLNRLYDDLHAIEDSGLDEPAGKESFEQARINFQQITSHCAVTRDRLHPFVKKFGVKGRINNFDGYQQEV